MSENLDDFYLIKIKPNLIKEWDNLLGFGVEEIISEAFYVERQQSIIGIRLSDLAVIEFDNIFGTVQQFAGLELIPADVLKKIEEKSRPKWFKKNDFDPMEVMKLIRSIGRIRFEILMLAITHIAAEQTHTINILNQHIRKNNPENIELAYKDLLGRVDKQQLERHYKANPQFLKVITEDSIIPLATTRN